jgi:hypothetical protein
LILVNSAAIYGQQGWAYDHLGHQRALALMFAVAIESIGIYLAAEAHAALMAGDASIRLRLGSYSIGALVGVLNYAHFADPGYMPNPLALTFGLLSSISPWLWAIRSRSLNRDRLRELGLIDPRAVRFAVIRWVMFPVPTFRAFRRAVWLGITQPAEAVALVDVKFAVKKATSAQVDGAEPVPVVKKVGETAKGREIVKVARRNPTASKAEIAAKTGASVSTVERHLPALNGKPVAAELTS